MKVSHREVLGSTEFRQLVARRWRVSLVLTAALFVLYYGYIIMIATNRQALSHRLGTGTTTSGILIAAAVIVGAWLLTAIYVVWANRHYDPAVAELRGRVRAD